VHASAVTHLRAALKDLAARGAFGQASPRKTEERRGTVQSASGGELRRAQR